MKKLSVLSLSLHTTGYLFRRILCIIILTFLTPMIVSAGKALSSFTIIVIFGIFWDSHGSHCSEVSCTNECHAKKLSVVLLCLHNFLSLLRDLNYF